MHSLSREMRPFVFSLALLFSAFATAFAQDVAVTVTLTQDFDKKPVAVNGTTQAKVKATADPVPPPYCVLDPASSWIWTWEVVSSPPNATVVITPDAGDTSQATVSASCSDSGDYPVFIKASVSIGNSCGPSLTGSGYCGLFVTAVKVKAIQYSVNGLPFQDVPSSFLVLLGNSVTFKALPSPDGASWPAGYPVWGGTSGASGTGETTAVTFNTLSPTATDYWTVTATCGNTETANVVVYDLVPIMTPQDNFEGRDLDAYGVCEIIDLSYDTVPSGISEYQIGGLKWSILSGGGELLGGAGGIGTYQCPDFATNSVLVLAITDGPFVGQMKQAKAKEIVEPSGVKVEMQSDFFVVKRWHKNMTCSAGFCGDYYATGPKKVSYKEIEVREGECIAEVTGFYEGIAQDHIATAWFNLKSKSFFSNSYQWDTPIYDKISSGSRGPEYAVGTWKWPIPNEFRKKGSNAQNGKKYATANQEWVSTVEGRCTISKAGSGNFSKNAADPTTIPKDWGD